MGMETVEYKRFKLTNNSKVRFKGMHLNTFSLRQGSPKNGGTCPGCTPGEEGCEDTCYDKKLRRIYKAYASVEDYNTELLAGLSEDDIFAVIDNSVTFWRMTSNDEHLYFRLHTGGDFYSVDYAKAWRRVIEKHKSVNFWTYTRSLFAVPILHKLKNLTLYLSCDPVNKDEVLKVYSQYSGTPNIALAWMGNTIPVDFPSDRKHLVCPEVTGKLANSKTQGACSRCRACVDRPLRDGNIRHVQFPIHK
jgi:hypothetical protein